MRKIREAKADHDIKAVTTFPAGCVPQVPVDDRRYYPIYQTCIDLEIPVIVNAGIAGPRVPSQCQDVMLFEQVCFDFPELTIVMRHGAEPWQELAVKLMVKWPNLYYMPSAFAPKYYPKAIIDYANTRGADRIMYAGYYPMGLSLRRIFEELPNVPFKDEVWPKFLRENAMRVLKLEGLAGPDGLDNRYGRDMTGAPNYTIISADTHAGGSHEQYREYLDPEWRDEFDEWRGAVQEPVEGPAQHRPAGPQLGRRAARRRRAGRRRGGRGAVPQHRAAVLPGVRALRRAAEAGGLRAAPGRASTPTTGGWSTSAPAGPSGGPASARSSSTTSTTRSPTPPGSRSTACGAACCCPPIPPDVKWVRPLYDPEYDPLWAALPGPRHPGAPPRRHRLARLRPARGGADHHGGRAALLREPQPRAHAARRACSSGSRGSSS